MNVDPATAERIARLLGDLAIEFGKLAGSWTGSLPSLASPEQQSQAMATRLETRSLLTTEELADTLRVNRRTLRDMVRRGDVPAPIRIGKGLRWRRTEIENWIQEQPAS